MCSSMEIKDEIFKDVLFKEIDLLQGCINRMAKNSFEIKKWSIGMVGILSGVARPTTNLMLIVYLFMIVMFWWLDAFFLRQEKNYREKYNWVIKNRSLDNTLDLFDLDPRKFYDSDLAKALNANDITGVMWSKTLRYFYLSLCTAFIVTRMGG